MPTALRLAVAVALLVLAGCTVPGAGSGVAAPGPTPPAASPTTAPSPSPSAATPESRPVSATPAPTTVPATLAFTSTTVDGQSFDGTSLAGKPVLLWFWAPWCPTCRSQTDDVQAVARDFAGKVAVIGVGSLADAAAIRGFAADVSGLTHLNDESGEVFRHFKVVQQSSFVLLDAQSRKAWSVGYGGSDDLAHQVAAVAG